MQRPSADRLDVATPSDFAAWRLDRAHLTALVENIPLGVIVAEAPSGRLVVANEKVAEIWGRPFMASESVAEYGAYHGFHADGRPYAPEEWPLARTIRTGEQIPEEEIVFERGDGTRGVMAVSAGPIRDADGRLVGGVVIFRDVTDERRAALRLALLAELSRSLAEPQDLDAVLQRSAERIANALGDGCAILLADDAGTSLQPAAIYHRDPAQPRFPGDSLPIGDETRGAGIFEEVLISGRAGVPDPPSADVLSAALPPSWAAHLERQPIGALAVAAMLAAGRPIGTIAVTRDPGGDPFTDDDVALLTLLADRATLAIEAAGLLAAERRSRELAEDALRSKDEMLRLIAHDLRNPLAVIQGYAELAKRHVPDGSGADRVADRLDRIAANARRMARQLAGLVDAAVLRASQPLELQVQDIDLRDLLISLAEEYRACYSELNLETRLPTEPLPGSYDTARMQSVIANLLDNAIKYSEPGAPICVEASRRDSSVEVRISDRGIGISDDDREGLFDPFFRARNASGYPGLGIGLAGAAKVVEQHGGEIVVDSPLGTGTTVTVRLPLQAGVG
jgi:PAS domain S-box-containing protein